MNKQDEIVVSQLKMGTVKGVRQPSIGLARITIHLSKPLIKKIQDKMKDDETRSQTITRLILTGLREEKCPQPLNNVDTS